MSELAFDKEGNPFRFSRRTKKLRPRRWKNAGQRGTCAAVLDADGEQVLIDANAEYIEFRTAVGNVPGFYRLDQCDDDGAPIEDAPPAYVSIESTRNAAPTGDVDPRDAIIRDLAQINADMVRTITERFGNVMQATADILRAADGAGLSRRQPPPPPPPKSDDDKDEEEDDEEDDDDDRLQPSERVWAFVEPMLPTIGAWIAEMASKRFASGAPSAQPSPAPASPASETATAAPSSFSAPGSGGGAAGPNAAAPVGAPEPVATSTPVTAAAPADSGTATIPVGATAPSAPPPVPAPMAVAPSSAPPPGAASEGSPLDNAAASTTAIAGPMPAGALQADAPRNAPPGVEPTPQQWAHLFAIRARLSPREAAITQTVATRMSPEMRAQWLAELSMLSVDQAVDVMRSMIPKVPPTPPTARNGAQARDEEGED